MSEIQQGIGFQRQTVTNYIGNVFEVKKWKLLTRNQTVRLILNASNKAKNVLLIKVLANQ